MYRRHDLVWLTPQGWDRALRSLSGAARELALDWRARDLPAVVRRLEPGTPPALVCLGIPAPPDPHNGHKRRLGFAAERRHIATVHSPLALAEAQAPAAWQPGLANLGIALRSAGVDCRVFGSLAMQTLTGDRYLGAGSDIDLLLRPASAAQLDAGLALVARHAQGLPLDGEIEFPSGHAVSWKEWLGTDEQAQARNHGGAARVLAKHLHTVALLQRDALLGQFGTNQDRHG
ncbi:malonate decarboxylase holo-[acyl-carrier-protein] synthase [Massilia sp. LXY-6]|uniref:malonate decarboxylase holo-[acyl-carrier-protein] synthase n=1 Tax=Massilia sp. LXY-6 TaxID=3379823 RepID=UPI003EDF15A2